jgi:hypothetical protein
VFLLTWKSQRKGYDSAFIVLGAEDVVLIGQTNFDRMCREIATLLENT